MNRFWYQGSRLEQRTAYLIAGHVAIAIFEGLEVLHVSMGHSHPSWIEVVEPDLSKSRLCSSEVAREDAKSVIRALLAGPAAQIRYSFGYHPTEFNLAIRFFLDDEAIWRAIALAGKIADDGPALIRNPNTNSVFRVLNHCRRFYELHSDLLALRQHALDANGQIRDPQLFAKTIFC